MVFYIPSPKRDDRGPGPASLASLPHELVLNVLETADTSDILNLRLIHSNLVGACNDILARRNTILYIHPTVTSLRQALHICAHPRFSRHIEEVVLLGRISWRDMEQVYPRLRDLDCTHNITASSLKGRFAAWPLQPFLERGAPQAIDDLPFEVGYKPLLEALRGLEGLRGISFIQGVRRPGWNQTSQKLIGNHASSCALPPKTLAQQMRYAHVDVLFKLVAALGRKITSLQVDGELPFAGPTVETLWRMPGAHAQALWPNPPCNSLDLSNILNLTSLDLVLDIGTQNEQYDLQRTLIARAASNLRNLSLTLVPQHARSQAAVAYEDLSVLSEDSILSSGSYGSGIEIYHSSTRYFPHLESLTLAYQDPPALAKCKNAHRLIRPSAQILDFGDLLYQVRQNIRRVDITNIIFTDYSPSTSPSNLCNPTMTNLQVHHALTANRGRDFPALEHFSWRVNRYTHDQKCRSPERGTGHKDCEKLSCDVYLPGCGVEMFDELAVGMGVEVQGREGEGEERMGWWDFGAGVMKARTKIVEKETEVG